GGRAARAGAALQPHPPRPGGPDLGRAGLARLARLHAGGAAVVRRRPVIGISCCPRQIGTEPAQAVMNRYVAHALKYADAAGLLVPALPELMHAREVAPRLDGLLLTGSPSNVEPGRYGEAGAPDAAGPYDPG